MEIPVLESILNDNLKPWLIDTSNVKYFKEAIKNINQTKCENYNQLHQQIIKLLGNEYKYISKKINNKYSSNQIKLVDNFYSIEIPNYTDAITQFYFLLISKETQRIFNSFILESKNWTDSNDFYFHTSQTLTSINALATNVNSEILERNYVEKNPIDNTHYILLILKYKLITLFFDIQELFKEHLNNIEDISSFCINYFDKIDTSIILQPTEELIRFSLNKLLNNAYNENEVKNLLELTKSIKSENKVQIIAAIQNYKYYSGKDINIQNFDELVNLNTISKEVEEYKTEILENVNTHNLGHQRLMIITQELEKIENHSIETGNKYSISSKIYNWLIQQKDLYQQHASNIFSNEETAKAKAKKLKSPIPKKSKANLEEQKQYASEHLAFLNGYNLQGVKIMTDNNYKLLINYTFYLIEKEKLPTDIKPLPQIGFSSIGIRYTYYKIHEYIYGTQLIRDNWIDFLHEVFSQFKNTSKSTTKAKFSTKPPSYDKDIEQMK
jgi:hypothetical protein